MRYVRRREERQREILTLVRWRQAYKNPASKSLAAQIIQTFADMQPSTDQGAETDTSGSDDGMRQSIEANYFGLTMMIVMVLMV